MTADIKSTVVKSNESELSSTASSCSNPSGFVDDTLICQPFSQYNPKVGLIMRGLSRLNEFALVRMSADQEVLQKINGSAVEITLYSLRFEQEKEDGKEYGVFREGHIVARKKSNLVISEYIGIYRHF